MDFPERAPDQQSNKNAEHFIRLKDKESVRGTFAGKPHLFDKHWNGKHTVECTAPDLPCEFCAKGERKRFSFRINFLMKDAQGKNVAKIFEQGGMVYDQIRALAQGGWKLDRTVVTISRTGSGLEDTVYTVLPNPDGILTEKGMAILAAIPLHDLAPTPEPAKTKQATGHLAPLKHTLEAPDFVDEDLPF